MPQRYSKELPWKKSLYRIIYDADTPFGKLFDVGLFVMIVFSTILIMLESVESIDKAYHHWLVILEWMITILFSIEYILRIISIRHPRKYIFSFYGIIDLLSTLPMYLSLMITGSHVLLSIRILRLLRIFRVLKLVRFLGEATQLSKALLASRRKIIVFIYAVVLISVILGTMMYLVEDGQKGFVSIPQSIYWTVVTLTTVGYGDIVPETPLGQFISTLIMILGYGIIAVPTGVVVAEMTHTDKSDDKICPNCQANKLSNKANYCEHCGKKI